MYTIRQAAARSGVGESLLRAWERRYGVVSPSRTASGYRLYDDAAIARLRAMRALVQNGWATSQAAEAVITGSAGLVVAAPKPDGWRRGAAEPLVGPAMAYDTAGISGDRRDRRPRLYESVVDDVLLPAVAALGTAWAAGRIDVAAEHLASAAVQRRLAALFDLGGRPGGGHPVVVGLPPGSRHEIGTLAFAVALRRHGVDVLYLGPDTPVASWTHVAVDRRAEAAVIGVPRRQMPADAGVIAALHAARPELVIAVGGPASGRMADGVVQVLPTRVTDAAEALARLVRAR
jgi:DNA-binding transcriptional MerR regulator/methylmalonyl-CoA mutase cobalamin-binding subunit